MSMGEGTEIYVGDGLYLTDDGHHIILRAPREDGDHYVYLDPVVFGNVVMQGFRIMGIGTFTNILNRSSAHIKAMEDRNG